MNLENTYNQLDKLIGNPKGYCTLIQIRTPNSVFISSQNLLELTRITQEQSNNYGGFVYLYGFGGEVGKERGERREKGGYILFW